MRSLTLGLLKLGLDDLLTVRASVLVSCQSGLFYKPILESSGQQINALPESLRGKKPLTEELGQADDDFDGGGNALWFICEAIEQSPLSGAEEVGAAKRVRSAMIPKRQIVNAAFPVEASAAKLNRSKLGDLEADLKSIPFPGGKTAYDVALVFVEAGEKIDALLSGRAMVEANVALREEAHALRGGTLQQLGNFRNALRDELKSNAALPRNLEELIFGYFDELSAQREKSSGKGTGKKEEAGGEK